jgi:hypothetical protein
MAPPVHEFRIAVGVTYLIHQAHRDGTKDKSQWTIEVPKELTVFAAALRAHWTDAAAGWGWGLHIVRGRVAYLGVGRDHELRVFVAKFLDGTHTSTWHGFPADHRRGPSDRPPERVMKTWLETKVLAPAKVRKIAKGKPCDL